jgi:hypothetical protein
MAGVDVYSGAFFAVHYDDRPLMVRARESLAEHPETAVVIGEAPDGLPLVLHVSRKASVESAVLAALGYVPREQLAAPVDHALEGLESAVRAEARRVGIERLDVGAIYRSKDTVGVLFGDTLMARMLGAHSPLVLAEDRHSPSSEPENVANTAAIALSPRPITVMKELDTNRYLAVPVRSGPAFVAELGSEDDPVVPESLQPLLFEDLRGLASARYIASTAGVDSEGPLSDHAQYQSAVRREDRVAWLVSRHDVGRAIADLAHNLQAFHDEDRVHCDVKPGNTLITGHGVVAIDPIGVRVGEVSPGATPGWAAPEQILARPVSAQSDVYALGLMAASLIGAAIYGEERSFIIPTGKSGRRRVRILGAPDVFIDRGDSELDQDSCRAWTDLIRRAVAFAPEERPASAAAFAMELEALLARQRLEGELAVAGGPGVLSRSVEVLGVLQPSWVVSDRR